MSQEDRDVLFLDVSEEMKKWVTPVNHSDGATHRGHRLAQARPEVLESSFLAQGSKAIIFRGSYENLTTEEGQGRP